MPDPRTPSREPLQKESITLTPSQWEWLQRRAVRRHTYSKSAELRDLVADAMERETVKAVA